MPGSRLGFMLVEKHVSQVGLGALNFGDFEVVCVRKNAVVYEY